MKTLSLSAAFLIALSGAACQRNSDPTGSQEEALAQQASDSAEVTDGEGALLSASSDGIESAAKPGERATPEAIAAHMSLRLKASMLPPSCVTVTVAGHEVTYVMNDCTGPRGLRHVTGTLVVDYSVAADGFHVDATANNLAINDGTASIDAHGVYNVTGTVRSLAVTTNGTGTGPLGNTITHSGDYTITWDSATTCRTLDGNWMTSFNAAQASTQVTGLERCAGACPAAGGKIVHTGLGGKVITIEFDGSADAKWSVAGGRSGTVALLCIPGA